MTTNIDRKRFLVAATSATLVLLVQACGGGGDGGSPPPPTPPSPPPAGNNSCGSTGAAIAGNHGHTLTIAAADLDATTAQTYDIQGGATHGHTITLSPTQLAALKAGQSVTVTSSTDLSHDHAVTVTCA